MAFLKLHALIDQRLRQAGVEKEVQAARVLQAAQEVMDELFGHDFIVENARPMSFRFGRLDIAVLDASLRQELHLRQEELLSLIGKRACTDRIKNIRFVMPV